MATYTLQCGKYDHINPNFPQYNTSMAASGSFTTVVPLSPMMVNADIKNMVGEWSVNDGVITYNTANSTLDTCIVTVVSFREGLLVVNCQIKITLKDNTGCLVMNTNSLGDSIMPMFMDSSGSHTMAQRWPTTFFSE